MVWDLSLSFSDLHEELKSPEEEAEFSGLVNKKAKITNEKWGVTLLSGKGFHAQIFIEGIQQKTETYKAGKKYKIVEGEQFAKIYHLMGRGDNQSGLTTWVHNVGRIALKGPFTSEKGEKPFELVNLYRKSQTWLISAEKVQNFINRIESEVKMPHPFRIFGNESFIAKKASVFRIYDKDLEKISNQNENLFLELYDLYISEEKPTLEEIERLNELIEKIKQLPPNSNLQSIMSLFNEKSVVWKKGEQNSCYTWAKSELKTLGIEIDSNLFTDGLISVTDWHLPYKINEKNIKPEVVEDSLKVKQSEICFSGDCTGLKGKVVDFNKERIERLKKRKNLSKNKNSKKEDSKQKYSITRDLRRRKILQIAYKEEKHCESMISKREKENERLVATACGFAATIVGLPVAGVLVKISDNAGKSANYWRERKLIIEQVPESVVDKEIYSMARKIFVIKEESGRVSHLYLGKSHPKLIKLNQYIEKKIYHDCV